MLSSDFMIVEDWFFENYMILNPEKCYFMCIGKNVSDSELLNLNDLNLENCVEVEILGITLNRNLNFKGHIKNICRAPVLWSKLPSEYKLAGSLTAFKSKIKSWKCEICTCRLCKECQPSLGYI